MENAGKIACPNCQRLERLVARQQMEIAELRARLEQLEARARQNSRNSSKPPSSDPPDTPVQPGPKRRKKRGARKGHAPHLKELLPPEKVNRSLVIEPDVCPACNGDHFVESGEPPIRDQFIDVPPVTIDVTEYVRPVRACSGCGALVYAPMPHDAPKSCFGPGVLALIGLLTGVLNVSKRKATMVMNEVFHVPMSLGGLSNCEARIADALDAPYRDVIEHIRGQAIAHADETGWRRGNRAKGWLWTLCCGTAAAFMVHARRGQEAARTLLDRFAGVLVTDRWGGYNFFNGLRQLCWAHLKRDFAAISEASGRLGDIGEELHVLATWMLRRHARVRDGTLQWRTFRREALLMKDYTEALLAEGELHQGALAGKCREIFKQREHLWTFVDHPDVPPTNNHAERTVRQGVMWRKTSFGTQSARGARYVERVLSVGASCRMQRRSVVEFLREACRCHVQHLAAPSLIK